MEGIVHRDANTLLALAHAERAAQLHDVTKLALGDQMLQLDRKSVV